MKYIDLVGYPIMLAVTYCLLGFVHWDKDPQTWTFEYRALWVVWGVAWGYAMSFRIKHDR